MPEHVEASDYLNAPLEAKKKGFDGLPEAPSECDQPRLETEMITMPDTERGLLTTEGN